MAGLTSQQLATWKMQFAVYDDDGNGKISAVELRALMNALGVSASAAEIAVYLKQATNERDCESISFPEFVVIMNAQRKRDEMLKAFSQFDVNGDGYITAEEIRQVMRAAGDSLNDDDVASMVSLADTDGDGKVNYEEFVAALGHHY